MPLVKGKSKAAFQQSIKTEIKAVTYHQVEVKKRENRWEAKVVFDV